MALREDIGRNAKKLVVPVAASVAGAGAGLALTRKSVRRRMPDLGGVGSIADDLRTKLDSVVGKAQPSQDGDRDEAASSGLPQIDPKELDQRLREREQRRKERRARS